MTAQMQKSGIERIRPDLRGLVEIASGLIED